MVVSQSQLSAFAMELVIDRADTRVTCLALFAASDPDPKLQATRNEMGKGSPKYPERSSTSSN
ncbi:hypothetical protein EB834_09600 [Brevibacterium aurantiacum]|uniref:Uncharacterized protein n=1 Tax=Brevibacterium aurantiacum TaxID=273384 RepID=A0A4Z0KJ93_BREAU|nr:hypothetical protein EB834_09600 [Brevibacterium aurantiacum]